MTALPKEVLDLICERKESYIKALKEAVAIPSISASKNHHNDIHRMIEFVSERLRSLGAKVDIVPNGSYPPIILGDLKSSESNKTVLIYGHLDVQPASKTDGWDTEPFELKEKDGRLYGRGSSDDKGPVLGWIHALEALKDGLGYFPVNVKFVFEGMEESDSEGLDDLLIILKDTPFLKEVDFVCVSDSYWLTTDKPCLGYGLRGVVCFELWITGAKQDLHSGVFGGSIHEAMTDLIALMDTLVDKDGKIGIEGIYDDVTELSSDESSLYTNIHFNLEEYKSSIGVNKLITNNDKMNTLMARWRYPSLSLHGIEGAFSEEGAKTVIPKKVGGKFSLRIVPNQTVENTVTCVKKHLEKEFNKLNSPNVMEIKFDGGEAWVTSPSHANYDAARKATKEIYGVDPDLTREGGSIPVVLTLENTTNKNVLLLPMGASDDGAHSQNEKIDVRNYIEGTKLFASYLYKIGQ
ncbi:CNDP2 [Lepeophtheirus salmonis]|uniref:CNDP2 n=2 Tax=Lepeophtheirus salmonis TaxID=72036 RepID=A0A7R8CFM4_LEPSM|nr:CNDP2 [Lepeophtheirus salmonis]CAF2752302.1 CNDP2 [Lepeophtheirus salmonis]